MRTARVALVKSTELLRKLIVSTVRQLDPLSATQSTIWRKTLSEGQEDRVVATMETELGRLLILTQTRTMITRYLQREKVKTVTQT